MHYLECIAMLEYLLKKMSNGQRTQVPVSVVDEVQTVIIALNKKLKDESNTLVTVRIRDILEAVQVVKSTQGILFLTEMMKDQINSGIQELLSCIRLAAFEYFKTHDFEPTPQIIPVMRSVVKEALSKGVI